ncbi:MAG: hypothetical protein AUK12_03125 [Candidatus Levybacteria bacterium CG2_30_37_29]|nr:MAG: hypothetical protein AUK12_03125 [Candidatus Levybacteria bacterium CG2_30_37_29]
MPAKNRIKTYIENGYYHIYNRGVEKRIIYVDTQDYIVFLGLLKFYLSPLFNLPHPLAKNGVDFNFRIKKTFHEEVDLLAFCLMPNHFHLLVHQKNKNSITEFMRAASTSYTMYFNKKYERVGSLFQGNYKASLVLDDNYLLYLSKYIHLNPQHLFAGSDPVEYPYSSYQYYIGSKKAVWVKPSFVLELLSDKRLRRIPLYKDFMDLKDNLKILPKELIID